MSGTCTVISTSGELVVMVDVIASTSGSAGVPNGSPVTVATSVSVAVEEVGGATAAGSSRILAVVVLELAIAAASSRRVAVEGPGAAVATAFSATVVGAGSGDCQRAQLSINGSVFADDLKREGSAIRCKLTFATQFERLTIAVCEAFMAVVVGIGDATHSAAKTITVIEQDRIRCIMPF